jgi:dTDP-glucose pyrophosphorylase/predicted transcriptional regulator
MKINFKSLLLSEDSPTKEAMEILDKYGAQIVLVVDIDNRLIGTITDGDIRRSILKGQDLYTKVSQIMNRNFKYVNDQNIDSANLLMLKNSIHHIPVLDENNFVIDLLFLDNLNGKSIFDNPVVIMAGGEGKRLRPLTENCPKPMLPIGGKPMLEIIIEQLTSNGFSNIYISVNYLKEKIIEFFKDGSNWNSNIQYLHEDIPLGTAGSLKLIKEKLDKPLLVMNGDVLTRNKPQKVLHYFNECNSYATMCARNYSIEVPFGIIEMENNNLVQIKEKPAFSYLVNAGIYALDPSIIELIDHNEFLDMPDLLLRAKSLGQRISVFPIHEYWLDVGRPETLNRAHTDWSRGY